MRCLKDSAGFLAEEVAEEDGLRDRPDALRILTCTGLVICATVRFFVVYFFIWVVVCL